MLRFVGRETNARMRNRVDFGKVKNVSQRKIISHLLSCFFIVLTKTVFRALCRVLTHMYFQKSQNGLRKGPDSYGASIN